MPPRTDPTVLDLGAAAEPGWNERLRGLPAWERTAVLRDADALRDGDEATRDMVERCYRALAEDLDPASAEGEARARWWFEQVHVTHPFHEPVVRVVLAESENDDLRRAANLRLAQIHGYEGRIGEAETVYRQVLEESRGEGDAHEMNANFRLAYLGLVRGQWLEALTRNRRAIEIGETLGKTRCVGLSLGHRALLYMELEAWERADRTLARMRKVLGTLSGRAADVVSIVLHEACTDIAVVRGWNEEALQHIAAFREIVSTRLSQPVGEKWAAHMSALALLGLGRLEEARAQVDAAGGGTVGGQVWCARQWGKVLITYDTDGPEAGGQLAVEMLDVLDALDDAARKDLGHTRMADYAGKLARALQDRTRDMRAALRAWDVAGAEILERILEIDRSLQESPLLSEVSKDDLRVVREHRDHLLSSRSEVLAAVARAIDEADREEAPDIVHQLASRTDALVGCAWCGRIRSTAGRWLPIGLYLPEQRDGDLLPVSHGICPDCLVPIRKQYQLDAA